MKNSIKIIGQDIRVKEWNGQRVVTGKEIDALHQRPEGTAKRNFNVNKERFIEGKHYFKITPYEFRTVLCGDMDVRQQNDITLFTEIGYLLLVKSFTDDLAWQVQEALVEHYFRTRDLPTQPQLPQNYIAALEALLAAEKENQALAAENAELAPKAAKYEGQLNLDGLYKVGEIAGVLGMTAIKLNKFLAEQKIQYKPDGSNTWRLYAVYVEMGLAVTRLIELDNGKVIQMLLWTPKGYDFIIKLMDEVKSNRKKSRK